GGGLPSAWQPERCQTPFRGQRAMGCAGRCLTPTPLGARRGDGLRDAEGFLDDAEHLLARAFRDGLEAAEVEAGEADAAGGTHDLEAEVGEEVVWEDRLVHMEALVRRLALGVAVGERLERAGTAVARF